MTHDLKAGDRWVYVGPGDGKNEVHLICDIWREGNEIEIATWGEKQNSWFGPLLDFLHQFKVK